MQMVSGFQQKLFYFIVCTGFTAACEVPTMLNAAERHGHGQPPPQKPSSVQPASDEI